MLWRMAREGEGSDAGWVWTDGGMLTGTFRAVYDPSAGTAGLAGTVLDVAPLRGP